MSLYTKSLNDGPMVGLYAEGETDVCFDCFILPSFTLMMNVHLICALILKPNCLLQRCSMLMIALHFDCRRSNKNVKTILAKLSSSEAGCV